MVQRCKLHNRHIPEQRTYLHRGSLQRGWNTSHKGRDNLCDGRKRSRRHKIHIQEPYPKHRILHTDKSLHKSLTGLKINRKQRHPEPVNSALAYSGRPGKLCSLKRNFKRPGNALVDTSKIRGNQKLHGVRDAPSLL